MRVSAPHIEDEFKFLLSVLIRVAVGLSGEIAKRIQRAIKAFFPTIDVLAIDMVFHSSFCYAVFFGVANKR